MLKMLVGSVMWMALTALFASPAPAADAYVNTPPAPYVFMADLYERIVCTDEAGNGGVGSGTRIGADIVLTAAHVVGRDRNCVIDGQRATTIMSDSAKDYALLRTENRTDYRVPISCEIPREGTRVWSFGHALGGPLMGNPYDTTASRQFGFIAMRGFAQPGQSGSAVLDERGFLVGILDARLMYGNEPMAIMFARPMADTHLCNPPRSADPQGKESIIFGPF